MTKIALTIALASTLALAGCATTPGGETTEPAKPVRIAPAVQVPAASARKVVAAALGLQQQVEVGRGLGEELGVFGVVSALDKGFRHLADQDGRVVEVGGGRELPIVVIGQPVRAREFDVFNEERDVLGDDPVVRGVIPFPLLHAAYYPHPAEIRHRDPASRFTYQGLVRRKPAAGTRKCDPLHTRAAV